MSPKDTFEAPLELDKKKDIEPPPPPGAAPEKKPESETPAPERRETEPAYEPEPGPEVSAPEKRVEGPQPIDQESLRRTQREARHETEPGKRESTPESDRESDDLENAARKHATQRGVSVTETREESAEEKAKKETTKAKVLGWFTGLATGGGLWSLAHVTGALAIGSAPILWVGGIVVGAIATGGILYEVLAKKIRDKYGGKRFE